ncbi:MAG: histidine kinase [Lewinellaceae bacterium]|nr:histidine kinase [Saprospiraceae bacterium]MCB9305801.1 histidine kinase [Lewinellaceae bacterium]
MKRRIWLHILFWLIFWFVYAYLGSRYDGNLAKYIEAEVFQLPARMLATYLSLWCFERFSGAEAHKTWLTLGSVAAANFTGGLLNRVVKMLWVVPMYFPKASFDFWGYMLAFDIFDCVFITFTALTVRLYFRNQEMKKRAAALQAEKLDAELQALKGQIHPHFLFNTINNLYALARRKSDKTAPVALKLAHLLRYVLYESAKPVVTIEQEVNNLKDYVELEKLRFDEDRLSVSLETEIDDPGRAITPLLLLPLIENAFKHGVSEKRSEAWVKASISLKNNQLRVRIENSKETERPTNPQGIGLRNVQRQLELLYPEHHRLLVTDRGGTFLIDLEIDL